MSDASAPWETPTIEVRVFRHGELVDRVLCESEEDASSVVERWSDIEDVTCTVDDLSFHHTADDVLEPEPNEPADEEYPPEPMAGPGGARAE